MNQLCVIIIVGFPILIYGSGNQAEKEQLDDRVVSIGRQHKSFCDRIRALKDVAKKNQITLEFVEDVGYFQKKCTCAVYEENIFDFYKNFEAGFYKDILTQACLIKLAERAKR